MDKVKTEDILQDYVFEECLSEGVYSQVFKGYHRDYDKAVTIKKISKKKIPADNVKRFHEWYELLLKLDHPNLVGLIQAYDNKDYFYLVAQFLNGGDLCDFVNDLPKRNEATICNIIKTLNDALEYCHIQGVIHRNLKPENIMANIQHGNHIVKILDYGMPKIVGEELLSTSYGSLIFQAPQIVAGKPYNSVVDFWSLGVLMYLLLCGKLPFKGSDAQIKQKIMYGRVDYPEDDWKYISSAAQDLLTHLLDLNPKTRFTATQIRNHPWMTGNVERQHPELSFNLQKYNAQRKLQKMQHMVRTALNITMGKI